MASNLIIGKDINGTVSNTISASSQIRRALLPDGVAIQTVVPPNVNAAFFAYGGKGDVWVDLVNAATLPINSFEDTTAELNPVSRYVIPGTSISCICSVENDVEISFYNTRGGAT